MKRDYWPTAGWQDADPSDHGLEPRYLARLDRFAEEEAPQINGLMVVRHGYVLLERYYRGYEATSFFTVNSITKSLISILTGVCVADGSIADIDAPLARYFPHASTSVGAGTLRQVLSHTSGQP